MCGIAGVVGCSFRERDEVLDSIAHRGPDGTGHYASPDGRTWLGHRRLAIIDPEGGVQPLSNEDGTIWVTFNGCIYNYLELAQALRQKGHRFRTYCDTEVIVHAYEEYGEECVNRFIGMFSFAVWDERRGVLFCARDRMGVKPFYYWQGSGKFAFASEIKALRAMKMFKPEVCQEALQEYLTFQAPLGEQTLFKGVQRMAPGCCMVVDRQGNIVSLNKYWDLHFEVDLYHTEDYFVDHLRLLLRDAVKIRLRSDVALGAHLSGGLDSSTVVCLATDLNDGGDPLKTFTGSFRDGPSYDETAYARMVSEKAGTNYMEIWANAEDFMEHIQNIIYMMDEPAAGPGIFPQYMVSRFASDHVKVVLGGQGGDEIFAGYARYLIGYLEECLKGAIDETEDTARYAATLGTIIPSLPMLRQYVPMLRYFWGDGLFEDQGKRYFRMMDRSAGIRDIYDPELFRDDGHIMEQFSKIFQGSDAASFLNRMLYFDMKVHLPALLHVEDRTSMAWGLESRVPLLDHRIAQLLASIPPVIKFKGGQPKYLFRKAIKNIIPDEVLNRKDKMGFPVPLHLWFKDTLKNFVKERLLDGKSKQRGIFNAKALESALANEKDFGRVVWGALCVELWFRSWEAK